MELVHRKTYQFGRTHQTGGDGPVRTASGRLIKKRIQSQSIPIDEDEDSALLAWDFEDELNLLGNLVKLTSTDARLAI